MATQNFAYLFGQVLHAQLVAQRRRARTAARTDVQIESIIDTENKR
jgi:hypothetical protein